MRTVYAVSSGEYSGYWVRAIFDTREDAQTHADSINACDGPTRNNSDFAEVEEFNFYPEGEQPNRVAWYTANGHGTTRHVGWDYQDEVENGTTSPFWVHCRTEAEARKANQDLAARRAAEEANLTDGPGLNRVWSSNG